TRPFACATHHSTTRPCSSCDSVGLSPVVPTGTKPSVPSAICQSTRPRKAFSSSIPLAKGVTRAVNEPRKLVLAGMGRSSDSVGRAMKAGCKANCGVQAGNPHLSYSIVTGKTAVKEAPNAGQRPRRLFAAVGGDGPPVLGSRRDYKGGSWRALRRPHGF